MHRSNPRVRSLLAFAVFCAVALASPALAQEPEELLAVLAEDFRVLRASDGFILTPLDDSELNLIEVTNGGIAIDGVSVDADNLEDLVGEGTARVLQELADMDPESLARALGADDQDTLAQDLAERRERLEELETQRQLELEELRELESALQETRQERKIRVRTKDRFSFGSSLVIREDEASQEAVVIGGALTILGETNGDAVAIGGPVSIQGRVNGDVVSIGGQVTIGPEADIRGEVTSIGGQVYDPHGRVRGGSVQVALGPLNVIENMDFDDWGWSTPRWPMLWHWRWSDAVGSIFMAVLLALWVLFLVLVGRDFVTGVADRTAVEPLKSGIVGLAVQVLFFPILMVVCFLLAISLIGIPLLLVVLPLSFLLFFLFLSLGYAGVAMSTGRLVRERMDWHSVGPYLTVLIGLLLIQGWTILGETLDPLGGPVRLAAWLLILFGLLFKYLVWTTGLGAVFLQSFGSRSTVPPPPPTDGTWSDSRPDAPAPRGDDRFGLSAYDEDGSGEEWGKSLDDELDEMARDVDPDESPKGGS